MDYLFQTTALLRATQSPKSKIAKSNVVMNALELMGIVYMAFDFAFMRNILSGLIFDSAITLILN